jgi:hypothetical protein
LQHFIKLNRFNKHKITEMLLNWISSTNLPTKLC